VLFLPNNHVATTLRGGHLFIWNLETGQAVQQIEDNYTRIGSITSLHASEFWAHCSRYKDFLVVRKGSAAADLAKLPIINQNANGNYVLLAPNTFLYPLENGSVTVQYGDLFTFELTNLDVAAVWVTVSATLKGWSWW
jgi:hypothetical protein